MTREWRIAVVGATGLVGEAMINVLEKRAFPLAELHLVASGRSAGVRRRVGDRELEVRALDEFDFAAADLALFSAGAAVSERYAPVAAAAGCVVIDNTSFFRNDPEIPLIVPEVNPEALAGYRARGIIANPNCSTIQMVVALKPLHDAAGITRINVATYQAVSGAGREAVERLSAESRAVLQHEDGEPAGGPPLAFNAVPHIDEFQPNGYTREEMKMVWETRKILAEPTLAVSPTAVRIPVYTGHSEAVHIETRRPLPVTVARELLAAAPGVRLVDDTVPGGYPTPRTHASGSDWVYVGRLREDISHERGLALWIVADNLLKGAALNSVQIAELLVKDFL